jgi:hypothetical protein
MFSTTFIASNPHTKIRSDRQISLPASKYIRQPFATPQDTSGITPHSIAILHAMSRCPDVQLKTGASLLSSTAISSFWPIRHPSGNLTATENMA